MSEPNDPLLADAETFLLPILGSGSIPLRVTARALPGGLDSTGVSQLTARTSGGFRARTHRLVLKRLSQTGSREARIYEEILHPNARGFSPALVGVQHVNGECRLYLEAIRPVSNWPWPETGATASVLSTLARLHSVTLTDAGKWQWLCDWDYETELVERSNQLVELLDQMSVSSDFRLLRKYLSPLRRLTAILPKLREQLFGFSPFGRTLIHGDVHPGNVMMRKTRSGIAPVLLDWGRSRLGSPLEDVSSWLQSLGYWEPSARRDHDTLLRTYLEVHGGGIGLTRDLRDACWLGGASNLLGGAILYHLANATARAPVPPERRDAAIHAAKDCLRVIRRADACWR